jgi:hypothetical protein
MGRLGSSLSESGETGGGVGTGWGAEMGARDEAVGSSGVGEIESVATELGSGWDFSRAGGRSVVECLPVVQGGIDRNSSKVRTRGLQHFQPNQLSICGFINLGDALYFRICVRAETYLSVLHGRLVGQGGIYSLLLDP